MAYINPEARLNRKQAALFLGVSPHLVGMWKTLGHIQPVDYSAEGHPLYRLGDLIDVDREKRSKADKSHRGPREHAA